jgi:hypothetical protein
MEEKTTLSKVGTVIKIIFTIALFVFIGALIFRMCQASYQGLEETSISPSFKAAYKESADVRTHAVNDEFSANGAVYAYSLVYIEKAGYLQFTVRYNTRHIEEVQETYTDFKEENIKYQLVDAKGKTYTPKILAHEEEYNYHYFKLEFTDVDFSTEKLSIKMILDGIDIKVGENSTLAIHKKDDTSIPYTFTDEEKATLNIK